ncbi:Tim17/Tim22/Tim23/Pmp24 family protein [Metarhizium robertsii]|uniref:NADH-ubiquinone oxidoreductase n=3 Tax=Metarhizium TaxID=5529 RepID=E9EX05_METRA|nr:NADH-ubiquinone oxidoreductase [Metarhizium robertsii ARSEF 23]EFY99625.1 NADH-ubiquinone oxidoreductase [Metarhizium robertsii ARSEF 23]EXV06303.1 Tim17/Tim22/Tim23/Pmp24 family protein [Metarhizium robertsii]KID92465.1 Mitochondrial import inner membrane translocase subunit Tim17 family protein [Metarhizium guizhouense ARSEF 977]
MDHHSSPSHQAPLESDKPYAPHDVLDETAKTAVVGLGGGFFLAAIRNAMSKRNVGALGVFTRGAPIIGICAAGPAAYAFFSRTMMNLREKEDAWSAAFGGFMCGGVLGLPSRRMPVVVGLGSAVGAIQGALYFLGGRIDSFKKESDEFERKERIRRTTRLPVEQTVAEIGEGRGIQPPGYEERRRERIKETYGFEINPVKATVEGSQ